MALLTKNNYRNVRAGDTIDVDGGLRKVLGVIDEIVFLSYPGQDEFDIFNKPEYYTKEQIAQLVIIEAAQR